VKWKPPDLKHEAVTVSAAVARDEKLNLDAVVLLESLIINVPLVKLNVSNNFKCSKIYAVICHGFRILTEAFLCLGPKPN